MRIRIHRDVAKQVTTGRKANNRSANQEVNMALKAYYAGNFSLTGTIDGKAIVIKCTAT